MSWNTEHVEALNLLYYSLCNLVTLCFQYEMNVTDIYVDASS